MVHPAEQDAFSFLMQQARQGQGRALPSSSAAETAPGPTDALTLLMQQARAGNAGTGAVTSTSRCIAYNKYLPYLLEPQLV